MEFRSMYYIQRYKKEDRPDREGVMRMIAGDYMGSAEFEFGSVQSSWKFLRTEDIELHLFEAQSKGGKAALVTFYVISTKLGIERFKDQIGVHLDGTTVGHKTKEWTGIWNKFNTDRDAFGECDLWLDVSGYVNRSLNGKDYTPARDDAHPVAFTADAELARRLYLELHASKNKFEPENARIGDMVSTYLHAEPIKICGLNEDDSISVKINKYAKAVKLDKRDVFVF